MKFTTEFTENTEKTRKKLCELSALCGENRIMLFFT